MLNFLAKKFLLPSQGYPITLSPHLNQTGAPIAVIDSLHAWNFLPSIKKIQALLSGRFVPDSSFLQAESHKVFLENFFGKESDLGVELLLINLERYSVLDEYSSLNDEDRNRITAYEALFAITQKQIDHTNNFDFLSIHLLSYNPRLCLLIYPTIVKIPILSIAKNIEIDFRFAVNKIRDSGHAKANDLIANLYELVSTQQKISLELLNYIKSNNNLSSKDEGSFLDISNINKIKSADLLIVYLKSSIEKILNTMATCILLNLDNKKTQKDKIKALLQNLDEITKKQFYIQIIFELTNSESMEELSNYRTGVLHKKGISKLQPHSYTRGNGGLENSNDVFVFLSKQRSKNCNLLIALFAYITDVLVKLKPPSAVPLCLLREPSETILHAIKKHEK